MFPSIWPVYLTFSRHTHSVVLSIRRSITADKRGVNALAIDVQNNLLVSAGSKIKVWDLATAEESKVSSQST